MDTYEVACFRIFEPAIRGREWLSQTAAATINVNTAQSTALNANFSGFNDEAAVPNEPYDPLFNAQAALLSPGWVATGGHRQRRLQLADSARHDGADEFILGGAVRFHEFLPHFANQHRGYRRQGGQQFLDVGNQAKLLGAKIIVDVNGFTDTPQFGGPDGGLRPGQ